MPESPEVLIPQEASKFDAVTRWVMFVNQEEPMSEDATLACEIIQEIAKKPYRLRAFWHESYGQWWVHPMGNPGTQIGCVFEFTLEAEKRRRALLAAPRS